MDLAAIRSPAAATVFPEAEPAFPMTVSELVQLGRAMQTLTQVADSLTNRGAFTNDEGRRTAAGRRFEKIADTICNEYLEVMSELRDTKPRTEREREDRSCELLAYDLNCDQDPTDVALSAVRRAFPGRY
nr:hypothetical protein [Methylobacterium sp. ZNC0032]